MPVVMVSSLSMQKEVFCHVQALVNQLGTYYMKDSRKCGTIEQASFGGPRTLRLKAVKSASISIIATEHALFIGMSMALTKSKSFGLGRVELWTR